MKQFKNAEDDEGKRTYGRLRKKIHKMAIWDKEVFLENICEEADTFIKRGQIAKHMER